MSRSPRRGLSLIEVVIVMAMLILGIGLLMPATRRVRVASVRSTCQNNLKQLLLAFQNYHDNFKTAVNTPTGNPDPAAGPAFPPGCTGSGAAPEERLSWMVALLPYVEQDAVCRQFDARKGFPGNAPAARNVVKVFLCPGAKEFETAAGEPVTHYVSLAGLGYDAPGRPAGAAGNGFMGWDRLTSLATIKDGTSNTVALVETRSNLGPWSRGGGATLRGFDPADLPLHGDRRQFGGHPTAMLTGFADGSVRWIEASIDPWKLAAAVTIDGGETINLDD